jgi:tetraacyldisaccharide 4'-kinase
MLRKDWESLLEKYALELVDGKRRQRWRDRALLWILFLLSRLFRNIIQVRHSLYDQGVFLRRQRFGCTVISVGNLTVGGTGKTPVVEFLARQLRDDGRNVAVLSRGYRSKARPVLVRWWESIQNGEVEILPRIVSDGNEVLLDSAEAGDEPYMLARNLLPGVSVVVDKDRVKAGRYAVRHLGADIMLLDDGFQYLRMKPAYNIVLVDSTRPFHNHHVLPRGLLREPIKHLRRADLIFLTKSDGSPRIRHLKRFIKKHNSLAEIIECNHAPRYLQNLHTGEQHHLDWLHGKKAAAISAIAVPEGFERYLEKLSAHLVCRERFIDHHRFSQEEIAAFCQDAVALGAECIITTEKDAVRFPDLPDWPIPVYYLRVEIEIVAGRRTLDEWIRKICFKN